MWTFDNVVGSVLGVGVGFVEEDGVILQLSSFGSA